MAIMAGVAPAIQPSTCLLPHNEDADARTGHDDVLIEHPSGRDRGNDDASRWVGHEHVVEHRMATGAASPGRARRAIRAAPRAPTTSGMSFQRYAV